MVDVVIVKVIGMDKLLREMANNFLVNLLFQRIKIVANRSIYHFMALIGNCKYAVGILCQLHVGTYYRNVHCASLSYCYS